MELNFESGFCKHFLQIKTYNRPRTICQLGRRLVWWTGVWALLATVAAILVCGFFYTWFNFFFNGLTFADIFGDTKWPILIGFLHGGWMLTNGVIIAGTIAIGLIAGTEYSKDRYRNYKMEKRAKLANGEYVEPEPSKTWQFIKGMWHRFHDKTCGIITYKNMPENYW